MSASPVQDLLAQRPAIFRPDCLALLAAFDRILANPCAPASLLRRLARKLDVQAKREALAGEISFAAELTLRADAMIAAAAGFRPDMRA